VKESIQVFTLPCQALKALESQGEKGIKTRLTPIADGVELPNRYAAAVSFHGMSCASKSVWQSWVNLIITIHRYLR